EDERHEDEHGREDKEEADQDVPAERAAAAAAARGGERRGRELAPGHLARYRVIGANRSLKDASSTLPSTSGADTAVCAPCRYGTVERCSAIVVWMSSMSACRSSGSGVTACFRMSSSTAGSLKWLPRKFCE